MKKTLIVFSIMVLFAGAAYAGEIIPPLPTTDHKLVSEVLVNYENAADTENAELWISLWDTDGIRLAPNEPMQIGKPEIWRLNKDGFGANDFEINIIQQEIVVSGSFGYTRGLYTLTIRPKGGGEAFTLAGKFLTICRKQPDGTWLIYRDTFNSDSP